MGTAIEGHTLSLDDTHFIPKEGLTISEEAASNGTLNERRERKTQTTKKTVHL